MRRALAPFLVLPLLWSGGAQAQPAPGVENWAAATFTLTTAQRQVLTVDVTVFSPTQAAPGASPRVRIDVHDGHPTAFPDDAPTIRSYQRTLRPTDLTITANTAVLTTSVGGAPLKISWVVGSGSLQIRSVGQVGQGAPAAVRIGNIRCTTHNAFVGQSVVHDDGAGVADPNALLSTRALSRGRCVTPEYPDPVPVP